jgi:signal peptidase I
MKEIKFKDSPLYEERFQWKSRRQNTLFILVLAMFVLLVLVVRAYWECAYGGVQVSGSSMERTLQSGDKLMVKKTGWWYRADYGDVIVVSVDDYSEWEGRLDSKGKQVRFLIKRLIAKAGDTVYCENGTVYLKKSWENEFTALDEPYAYYLGQASSYDFGVYELQEGEIFFLGDNRQNSQDSRYKEDGSQLGYLYKESDIYGVVPDWAIEYKSTLEGVFFRGD